MKVGCISLKASFKYIQQHKNRKTELYAQCVVYIFQNQYYLQCQKCYIDTNLNKDMKEELSFFLLG